MTPEGFRVSSEQFWLSGAVMALVDAAFVLLLAWRIRPPDFRGLRWLLAGAAAVSWSIFAVVLVSVFWDAYYRYFFPGWFRPGGILAYVPILYGGLAVAFHWLSLRMPGSPLVNFCILGGLASVLEHLWGIYGLKILEVPLLQDVHPAAVLAFAFPEYVFYWCVIIGLAGLLQSAWRWRARLQRR